MKAFSEMRHLLILTIITCALFNSRVVAAAEENNAQPLMQVVGEQKGASGAIAPMQTISGNYYDWMVLEYKESPEAVKKCYIASFPKEKVGNYPEERKPYILVTHFADSGFEEVSVYSDYEYKLNSYIYLGADDENFKLFTRGKLAWAKTLKLDREIIKHMLSADTLKIRGDSSSGHYTVDTYSVKGIVHAYKHMRELCGK